MTIPNQRGTTDEHTSKTFHRTTRSNGWNACRMEDEARDPASIAPIRPASKVSEIAGEWAEPGG